MKTWVGEREVREVRERWERIGIEWVCEGGNERLTCRGRNEILREIKGVRVDKIEGG